MDDTWQECCDCGQVADLGSARSATSQGYADVEQRPPSAEGAVVTASAAHVLSSDADHMPGTPVLSDDDVHLEDLYVQPGDSLAGHDIPSALPALEKHMPFIKEIVYRYLAPS